MIRNVWTLPLVVLLAPFTVGCPSGGVGDPCVPEDEFRTDFSGFALGEVNVESRSFQCESRVCLVNSFQGRVSCPYGQIGNADEVDGVENPQQRCVIPGGNPTQQQDLVIPPVTPQRAARPPEDAVYCSCRCNGPDPNARYCECPSGFSCTELIPDFGPEFGGQNLSGSYCVRSGTNVDNPLDVSPTLCEAGPDINNPIQDCGPATGPQ